MERLFMMTLIAVCIANSVSASTMGDVNVLLQDLFTNYSTEIRPVKDQSSVVKVNVDFSLVAINDFDEVTGIISVTAIVYLSWTDESLVWDSSKHGNTSSLVVSQDNVWLPKLFLRNPAEDVEPVSNTHFKVHVFSNGTVLWTPGGILKAICTPDVSKFPFDHQTCTLTFGVWGYYVGHVSLSISSPTILFDYYSENSEWNITGSRTSVQTLTLDLASFAFRMKRRPMTFLVNVVIPIIMLALVNPFLFLLPFNSGERASYSITILLAFTVYMTVVNDRMPASSEPISYISYYLLTMLAMSVLMVTMNVFQIRMYCKDTKPIPEWMEPFMSRLIYICERINVLAAYNKDKRSRSNSLRLECNTSKRQRERLETETIIDVSTSPVALTSDTLDPNRVTMVTNTQDETITWKTAAKIADKTLFVVFLFLTIIVTVTFFLSVAIYGESDISIRTYKVGHTSF